MGNSSSDGRSWDSSGASTSPSRLSFVLVSPPRSPHCAGRPKGAFGAGSVGCRYLRLPPATNSQNEERDLVSFFKGLSW